MPHLPVQNEPCYFEFADKFHVVALEVPGAPEEWRRIKKEIGIADRIVGETIFMQGERIMVFPLGQRMIYGVPGTIGKGARVRHELQGSEMSRGQKVRANSPAEATATAIERAASRLLGILNICSPEA